MYLKQTMLVYLYHKQSTPWIQSKNKVHIWIEDDLMQIMGIGVPIQQWL